MKAPKVSGNWCYN